MKPEPDVTVQLLNIVINPVPVMDLDPVPVELKLVKLKSKVDISNVPAFTIKVVVPLYVCVASNVSVTPDPFTPIPFNGLLN